MRIVAHIRDAALRSVINEAAAELEATVFDFSADVFSENGAGPRDVPDVMIVELASDTDAHRLRSIARRAHAALLFTCTDDEDCPNLALADADDWLLMPATADELKMRMAIAQKRSRGAMSVRNTADAAELLRYEELLYDKLTGFPTLPVMIDRARELLEQRGELTVL